MYEKHAIKFYFVRVFFIIGRVCVCGRGGGVGGVKSIQTLTPAHLSECFIRVHSLFLNSFLSVSQLLLNSQQEFYISLFIFYIHFIDVHHLILHLTFHNALFFHSSPNFIPHPVSIALFCLDHQKNTKLKTFWIIPQRNYPQ